MISQMKPNDQNRNCHFLFQKCAIQCTLITDLIEIILLC